MVAPHHLHNLFLRANIGVGALLHRLPNIAGPSDFRFRLNGIGTMSILHFAQDIRMFDRDAQQGLRCASGLSAALFQVLQRAFGGPSRSANACCNRPTCARFGRAAEVYLGGTRRFTGLDLLEWDSPFLADSGFCWDVSLNFCDTVFINSIS